MPLAAAASRKLSLPERRRSFADSSAAVTTTASSLSDSSTAGANTTARTRFQVPDAYTSWTSCRPTSAAPAAPQDRPNTMLHLSASRRPTHHRPAAHSTAYTAAGTTAVSSAARPYWLATSSGTTNAASRQPYATRSVLVNARLSATLAPGLPSHAVESTLRTTPRTQSSVKIRRKPVRNPETPSMQPSCTWREPTGRTDLSDGVRYDRTPSHSR